MKTALEGGARPAFRLVPGGGRLRPLVFFVGLAASVALAGGCAGGAAGRITSADSTRITAEELADVNVSNAYDAVAQLRPLWLRSRGRRSSRLPTEIIVAQDGRYFGPLSSLRQFPIDGVKELRYLDAPQAGAFLTGLGSRHVEGAIVVEQH